MSIKLNRVQSAGKFACSLYSKRDSNGIIISSSQYGTKYMHEKVQILDKKMYFRKKKDAEDIKIVQKKIVSFLCFKMRIKESPLIS